MLWKDFAKKIHAQKVFVVSIPVSLSYVLLLVLSILILSALYTWINRDNWSTLIHNQYGFSVDYPTNWVHETFGERGSKNLHELKATMSTRPIGPFGPSEALWIYWVPMDNPSLDQLDDWGTEQIVKYAVEFSDLEKTTIGLNNYPALKRSFWYKNSSEMVTHYYVINEKGGFMLEFYLRNRKNELDAKPVFTQMLTSFYMFDPTTATDGLRK